MTIRPTLFIRTILLKAVDNRIDYIGSLIKWNEDKDYIGSLNGPYAVAFAFLQGDFNGLTELNRNVTDLPSILVLLARIARLSFDHREVIDELEQSRNFSYLIEAMVLPS